MRGILCTVYSIVEAMLVLETKSVGIKFNPISLKFPDSRVEAYSDV